MRIPRLAAPFWRILAVLIVLLGIAAVATRVTSFASHRLAANDFTQDYVAAAAWARGDDPFAETDDLVAKYLPPDAGYYGWVPEGQRSPHPPFLIVLHRPLIELPYDAARASWLIAMAVFLALGTALAARAFGFSRRVAFVLGAGALALPVAQKDLIYAQSNGLLMLLLVGGWLALRGRRDALAGGLIGIAVAIKLFPLFLVIPLLRARRFAATGWLVGVAAVATGASGALLGIDATVRLFTEVAPANLEYWRAAPMNIPLLAVPFRWLTPSPWRPDAPDLPLLATALALAVVVVAAAGAYRTPARLTSDPFWDAVPFMLLATPILWDSSLVLIVPVAMAALGPALRRGVVPSWVVLAAALVALVGSPPGLPNPQLARDAHQLLGFALPTYALVALTVCSYRKRALELG